MSVARIAGVASAGNLGATAWWQREGGAMRVVGNQAKTTHKDQAQRTRNCSRFFSPHVPHVVFTSLVSRRRGLCVAVVCFSRAACVCARARARATSRSLHGVEGLLGAALVLEARPQVGDLRVPHL